MLVLCNSTFSDMGNYSGSMALRVVWNMTCCCSWFIAVIAAVCVSYHCCWPESRPTSMALPPPEWWALMLADLMD